MSQTDDNEVLKAIFTDALASASFRKLVLVTVGYTDGRWAVRAPAEWVRDHPKSQFLYSNLNIHMIDDVHDELVAAGLAAKVSLHLADPKTFLQNLSWADVVMLDGRDLRQTLDLFYLAVSSGASTIVMTDYSTKAALAASAAKELGWDRLTVANKFIVLKRPR